MLEIIIYTHIQYPYYMTVWWVMSDDYDVNLIFLSNDWNICTVGTVE